MQYKYEIHAHTKETSVCGKTPAAELVRLYKEAGFSGIVITDHYSPMTFPIKEHFNKKKARERYWKGYYEAKQYEDESFIVLPGMELRFYATINDYLVYGMDEKLLSELPHLLPLYIRKASKLLRSKGCIVIQAHPFRRYMRPVNPVSLDGVEICNGKNTKEQNEKARAWAKTFKHKAICTGGSDFHSAKHLAGSGIITNEKITCVEDLVRILRSGEYEIIEPEYK